MRGHAESLKPVCSRLCGGLHHDNLLARCKSVVRGVDKAGKDRNDHVLFYAAAVQRYLLFGVGECDWQEGRSCPPALTRDQLPHRRGNQLGFKLKPNQGLKATWSHSTGCCLVISFPPWPDASQPIQKGGWAVSPHQNH